MLDYDTRLLFVTGFGAIYFLFSWIILILLPASIPKWFKISEWESGPSIIPGLLLLVFNVTAFAFYIRYVGNAPLSFYIMFKVFLVCLLPIIILWILYKNKSLEQDINILQEQIDYYFTKISENEKTTEEKEFEIISDNKSDKLILNYSNIVFVKSADNYVEIYYLQNDVIEKKMVRNTLKNIQFQFINYRRFIRCHRAYIVNILYIDKLVREYGSYGLKMKCSDEILPVARQFILPVKVALTPKN